jgi:SAM-dependent methyltransferase
VIAARYDEIGVGYGAVRRADPRLAAPIHAALGNARSVLNVGAGAGSYEPADLDVVAVEPSAVMRAQRPADAAPAVCASAESLPFPDGAFDAAMAVLTVQHWDDLARGLAELRRVARGPVVLVTMDAGVLDQLWLIHEYLPELRAAHRGFPPIGRLLAALPGAAVAPLAVPRDCADGFLAAFWGRPESYLDPVLRSGTSPWSSVAPAVVDAALSRLRADLADGSWDARHGALRSRSALDAGLRLITQPGGAPRRRSPPRSPRR